MKVTIEFNEDEMDVYKTYMKAPEMVSAISEFRQFLRHKWKYEEMDEKTYEELDKIYGEFCRIFEGVDNE